MKLKVNDSIHHCTPKARTMGRGSRLNSMSFMSSALSENGICWITSFLLDVNLCRLKPPRLHISLMSFTSSTAFDVRRSAGDMFRWIQVVS